MRPNERYTKGNILQSVPNIKTVDGMKGALSDQMLPEQSYSQPVDFVMGTQTSHGNSSIEGKRPSRIGIHRRTEDKPSNKQLKKDLIELARNLRKSYQEE